ncbi:hypothetical protein ABVT39_018962 [Epinephelus coioides]
MARQCVGQPHVARGQQHQAEGTYAAVKASHRSLAATETGFINLSHPDSTIVAS